ncbi:MAG: ATP-binding cassette domain-containing protein [Deltaproteobacteria bacterium]|nr:ATP-binding cassette domain-containing protein [Deltaproteobacteria bacterium]
MAARIATPLDPAPPSDPVVEVTNLTAGYGGPPILTDVSFVVPRGKILALIGGSGCGKSTVIRCLVGLLRPMTGSVRLFGHDPHDVDEETRIQLLRRLGMLFQGGALLGSITVGDNVALPFREHTTLPAPLVSRIVEAKLALVGLPGAASLMPAQLSGGMRKRASLSRAMALDPELLLCDEPSAGLDPVVAAGIDATLRRLQRQLGMTMIVVTHDLASVILIADYVVMLDRGRVLAQGSVAELQASSLPAVQNFFNREAPSGDTAKGPSLLEALERTP